MRTQADTPEGPQTPSLRPHSLLTRPLPRFMAFSLPPHFCCKSSPPHSHTPMGPSLVSVSGGPLLLTVCPTVHGRRGLQDCAPPHHMNPQTLNLPGGCVSLGGQKRLRRQGEEGLPRGGRSRPLGATPWGPAHVYSPRPLRGPQIKSSGEKAADEHTPVVLLYQPLQSTALPTRSLSEPAQSVPQPPSSCPDLDRRLCLGKGEAFH